MFKLIKFKEGDYLILQEWEGIITNREYSVILFNSFDDIIDLL
jgi:hypothetical protein